VLAHVETARDGCTVRNPYGEVKGISRAWGKISTGIKNKLSQKRLVERRIINHELKFSTISAKREEFLSIFSTLTILFFIIKLSFNSFF